MPADAGISLALRSAVELAALVRSRQVAPVEVVRASLDRIAALDGRIGAFQSVRGERALAEAEALSAHGDLDALPLAGVPVAVKDNLAVAGEPRRLGSAATSAEPSERDHETVARLRAAGAIVVGITRMPELGIWGTTDGAFGVTRNPWDPERTPGGSSGGGAAAVAAGMAPLALANDGMGSIRIPAAACGLFGIKPGRGLVPRSVGRRGWFGMAENGPLATTVADAALMLAVLAGRPMVREVAPPDRPLKIALSLRSPLPGIRVDAAYGGAAEETARLLAAAGHRVVRADPPYPLRFAPKILARWFAGAAEEAAEFDPHRLEPRTRGHARVGRIFARLGLVRAADAEAWRRLHAAFFRGYDLLLTPALASPPIAVGPWSRRSWIANLIANSRYAPFAAPWNFAGYPAAAVPAGMHPDGIPLSVQLVAPDGQEPLILSIARQLETLRPWPRHAPLAEA